MICPVLYRFLGITSAPPVRLFSHSRWPKFPRSGHWIPATYYFYRPIRPYSGYRGRWRDLAGMIGKDTTDLEARRLTDLFQSDDARRFTVRIGLRISGILFAPMALAAFILRYSLTWTLVSPEFFLSWSCAVIGCWIGVFSELLGWGIQTWGRKALPANPYLISSGTVTNPSQAARNEH